MYLHMYINMYTHFCLHIYIYVYIYIFIYLFFIYTYMHLTTIHVYIYIYRDTVNRDLLRNVSVRLSRKSLPYIHTCRIWFLVYLCTNTYSVYTCTYINIYVCILPTHTYINLNLHHLSFIQNILSTYIGINTFN